MKMSQIFRKAAKEVRDGEFYDRSSKTNFFCCDILGYIQNYNYNSDAHEYFKNLFKPMYDQWNNENNWYSSTMSGNQETRRLALLLAAEIAESEGK